MFLQKLFYSVLHANKNMAVLFNMLPSWPAGSEVTRHKTWERKDGRVGTGVSGQAHASFKKGGGTGAATQFQSFVAMWEYGPSVAKSSIFFSREARNLEFYKKSSNLKILATNSKYF